MEKMNKDYLEETIKRCKLKLLEIEKVFGKESDQWHIANENLLNHKHFKKHGIPKTVEQSTEIPYDLVEGF